MPRIVATPHRMMAAHEVDAMAAMTRAHIDGLGVRWQCWDNIRLSGSVRGRCLRWLFRLQGGAAGGAGGRRGRTCRRCNASSYALVAPAATAPGNRGPTESKVLGAAGDRCARVC